MKIAGTSETACSALIAELWQDGFFIGRKSASDVGEMLSANGYNFSNDAVRKALDRAKFLRKEKINGSGRYLQRRPAISKAVDKAEVELFDKSLIDKFGADFKVELQDLQLNFGKSGNCTAFVLRKILEKLLYIKLCAHGFHDDVVENNGSNRIVGLEKLITVAVQKKNKAGQPFLTANTAKEVRGIKFLGDSSAHNPLTDVDMATILPQMPYIITAYKELLSS